MADEKDKAKDEQDSASVEKLLFKSRTVLITGEINDKLAREASARLLALAEDNDDPIVVAEAKKSIKRLEAGPNLVITP